MKINMEKELNHLAGWIYDKCSKHPLLQKKQEFVELIKIARALNPRKRCLEIGTLVGGSARAWLEIFDEVYCIDNGANEGFDKFIEETDAVGIKGDSHDIRTLYKLKHLVSGGKPYLLVPPLFPYEYLDFIFHDGDHLYEGIKRDFELYFPLLRPGGIFAIHDIIADGERLEEAHKFWEEIKLSHKTQEILYLGDEVGDFFKDRHPSEWGGIGVIIKE